MFPILIAVLIFLIVAAASWWFGLWSNLITLVNLFIASLVASSIYQPVANQFIEMQRSFVYLADFICVWLCFFVVMGIMRGATDTLSGYRLKFNPIVEMVGRTVLALWMAGVFTCFSMFTLQMAPLSRDFYDKSVGTLPDRAWLAFVQSRSRGALSASKSANPFFAEYELEDHPDDVDLNARVFDPKAMFLVEAEMRRFSISLNKTLRVTVENPN